MKPILVTGASGFLGKHLVNQLIARGEGPLRLFARETGPLQDYSGLEVIQGDIRDAELAEKAVADCRQIYHLAGFVSRDAKDDDLLFAVHVGGTRLICEAALRHGVEKLVIASSSGTVAASRTPTPCHEESGYTSEVVKDWAYYRSKIEVEKLVLKMVEERQLPAVIVNPALLLGPGDQFNSSTGDVALFLRGLVMTAPLGGMSFVDARDAAAGVIAAMEKGRNGERYLLGGENWEFSKIAAELGVLANRKPPTMKLPLWMTLFSAKFLRAALRMAGKPTTGLDDVSIRMSALFWYCDSSKAQRELGFQSRPGSETLADTVRDLRRRGVV